jgi:TonB family protein
MALLGPSLRRRGKPSDHAALRLAAAVVVSLLLNALVFYSAARLGAFDVSRPREARQVALAPLTADQWDANRAIAGAPSPRAPARPPNLAKTPPPPPPPIPKGPKQVVDVAPSKESRRPDDAKYLAERDSTVEKETRARDAGKKLHENTLPSPSEGPQGKRGSLAAGDGGRAAVTSPSEEGGRRGSRGTGADRLVLPDQRAQEQLALAPDRRRGEGLALAPKEGRPRVGGRGEELKVPGPPEDAEGGGERRSGALDPRLLPDADSMARIAGGPSLDRLEGVEEGDVTALNAYGFKYATFINRMGRAILSYWDPNRAYNARDPDHTMYANRDRTTWVLIELSSSGDLAGIRVLERSGLDFLDEEVVRAVRAAAPFPNPPSGIAESDGHIRLAFGYTLRAAERIPRGRVVLPSAQSQRVYPE